MPTNASKRGLSNNRETAGPGKKQCRKSMGMHVATHAVQNGRAYMEDRIAVHSPFLSRLPTKSNLDASTAERLHFFGIFDGHGGSRCADFSSQHIPKLVKSQLNKGLHPVVALIAAHMTTEVKHTSR